METITPLKMPTTRPTSSAVGTKDQKPSALLTRPAMAPLRASVEPMDMFVLPCAETKIMPPPPRQMGIMVLSTLCRFCSCHSLPPERKEKTIRMVARPMKGKNF